MSLSLTEKELTGLRWMKTTNLDRIGFLGPTVKRDGPVPEYQRLVELGLARVIVPDKRYAKPDRAYGYWITRPGLALLGGRSPNQERKDG